MCPEMIAQPVTSGCMVGTLQQGPAASAAAGNSALTLHKGCQDVAHVQPAQQSGVPAVTLLLFHILQPRGNNDGGTQNLVFSQLLHFRWEGVWGSCPLGEEHPLPGSAYLSQQRRAHSNLNMAAEICKVQYHLGQRSPRLLCCLAQGIAAGHSQTCSQSHRQQWDGGNLPLVPLRLSSDAPRKRPPVAGTRPPALCPQASSPICADLQGKTYPRLKR